jgi:hypothetical protein
LDAPRGGTSFIAGEPLCAGDLSAGGTAGGTAGGEPFQPGVPEFGDDPFQSTAEGRCGEPFQVC